MRFCLISTQPDWGGGEKLIWSIRTALIHGGHQISWLVRARMPLHHAAIDAGDPIIATVARRGNHPRDWWRARLALRNWAPDVLLMNDSHAIMLGGSTALTLGPVRPLRMALRHVVFPIRSPFKLRSMSDHIVCVSKAAQASVLAAGIQDRRTSVIYGGYEPPVPDPNARQWAERELDLKPGAPLLVCVGNLLNCKGQMDLVEAGAVLRQQYPDGQIVLIGEGNMRAELKSRIQALQLEKFVRLLGFRTDADRWVDAASVVVHPSLQEGLSLVLIQAQMLRKLIVSTAVGGAAEVLGRSEPQPCLAWIAEPGNATTLAHQTQLAIEAWKLGKQPYANELDRAAQRARQLFDIRRNAGTLAELARTLREQRKKSTA